MSWKIGLTTLTVVLVLAVVSTTATGQDGDFCTVDCTEISVEYFCSPAKNVAVYDNTTCFACGFGAKVCQKNPSTSAANECKPSPSGEKVTGVLYAGFAVCDKACDQKDDGGNGVGIVEGFPLNREVVGKLPPFTRYVCLPKAKT